MATWTACSAVERWQVESVLDHETQNLNRLFDQGAPVSLRRHLAEHTVDTAFERGWSDLRNGALLDHAEMNGYQLLVMTDQNLRHQRNLNERTIAITVLLAASQPEGLISRQTAGFSA